MQDQSPIQSTDLRHYIITPQQAQTIKNNTSSAKEDKMINLKITSTKSTTGCVTGK